MRSHPWGCKKKDVIVNELLFTARKNYYDWIVLEKTEVLDENKLLKFMMQVQKSGIKTGWENQCLL